MIINLNDKVKIKLTKEGKSLLRNKILFQKEMLIVMESCFEQGEKAPFIHILWDIIEQSSEVTLTLWEMLCLFGNQSYSDSNKFIEGSIEVVKIMKSPYLEILNIIDFSFLKDVAPVSGIVDTKNIFYIESAK